MEVLWLKQCEGRGCLLCLPCLSHLPFADSDGQNLSFWLIQKRVSAMMRFVPRPPLSPPQKGGHSTVWSPKQNESFQAYTYLPLWTGVWLGLQAGTWGATQSGTIFPTLDVNEWLWSPVIALSCIWGIPELRRSSVYHLPLNLASWTPGKGSWVPLIKTPHSPVFVGSELRPPSPIMWFSLFSQQTSLIPSFSNSHQEILWDFRNVSFPSSFTPILLPGCLLPQGYHSWVLLGPNRQAG